jgi:hypothetical protein
MHVAVITYCSVQHHPSFNHLSQLAHFIPSPLTIATREKDLSAQRRNPDSNIRPCPQQKKIPLFSQVGLQGKDGQISVRTAATSVALLSRLGPSHKKDGRSTVLLQDAVCCHLMSAARLLTWAAFAGITRYRGLGMGVRRG